MRSDSIRRALTDRVTRRVAGSGISRRAVEETVAAVVSALDARPAAIPAAVPAGPATLVAALMSPSAPDIGSRVRAALQSAGTPVLDLGVASAGRHTVVTVRVPETARGALEAVAAALQLALTIVPDEPARP